MAYAFFWILGILLIPLRSWLVKRYLQSHGTRKLHLGCGPHRLSGWLNTDLNPFRSLVLIDASRRLPFDPGTFDCIFTEHLIEHLELRKGMQLLRECYRVLKPGGRIRIATPDLEFLIHLEGEKSELKKRYIEDGMRRTFPYLKGLFKGAVINHFFRAWGHQFIYDEPVLAYALSESGFKNTVRCEIGRSLDPNLKNLESHGKKIGEEFNRLETMVLEAVKPAGDKQEEMGSSLDI